MKFIVAVIQPDRLNEVLELLVEKEVHLVTVTTVMGRGRQKGISEVYRSHKEAGSLLRKVKLEIAVNDGYVAAVKEAIVGGAIPDRSATERSSSSIWRMSSHPHRRASRLDRCFFCGDSQSLLQRELDQ
jgi:nitrogen regulatory protein PII